MYKKDILSLESAKRVANAAQQEAQKKQLECSHRYRR